jgi:hypothetical protein
VTEDTAELTAEESAGAPGDDVATPADEASSDDTQPTVELSLYQLSVSVAGRSDDDLADVQSTASELMDFLVDRAETLEEDPDDRGLG